MKYVLSERDHEVLRNVVQWWEHLPQKMRSRPQPGDYDEYTSPEVYVARTPNGGIPALNVEVPSPSVVTGTGTDIYDEPGRADCTIYQLLPPAYGTATGPEELRSAGFTRKVYNLGLDAVPANTWVLVSRDKFGRWYVTGSGSSGASGATCSTVKKRLIGSCVEGSVRKLIFGFERCCDCVTLATICETEPSDCAGLCGPSGTGSTGPPTGGCPCGDTASPYWIVNLSGVTDGTCTGCANFNGNYCLTWFKNICQASSLGTGPSSSSTCSNYGGTPPRATIDVFPDGSATLTFSGGVVGAIYYTPAWSCTTANTMTLLNTISSSPATCITWPTTVTVSPSATLHNCSSGGAAGSGCSSCAANTWSVTITGATDGTCVGCTGLNTTYTLTLTSACTYDSNVGTDPLLTCPGPSSAHTVLFDNGVTGWELWITTGLGTAKFFTPYSTFSCSTANVRWTPPYSDSSGCGFGSSTISVLKTS